jgi:mRNA interferase RelE/StbE
MIEFTVKYSNKAKRNLKKIPLPISQEIIKAISVMKSDPYRYAQKMEGSDKVPLYSLHVGGYRAIISIQNKILIIYVVEVGPRKTIYRKY